MWTKHSKIVERYIEARDYVPDEDLSHVGIGTEAKLAGSPQVGDKICRDPDNHADQWLVTKAYFDKHYAPSK